MNAGVGITELQKNMEQPVIRSDVT